MKDASAEVIVCRGKEMLALCRKRRAVLVVNDAPQLAVAIGADGVHLGQADMPPIEARRIIGDGAVIGSTANTFEQIAARNDGETDYVGLGPPSVSRQPRKNLSPVLGTEGYRTILGRMRTENIPPAGRGDRRHRTAGYTADHADGVDGIALSGAIARADSPATTTANFLNAIRNA